MVTIVLDELKSLCNEIFSILPEQSAVRSGVESLVRRYDAIQKARGERQRGDGREKPRVAQLASLNL
jgi:hypothetical protein